jgi:molecular chaperone GrpE
MTGPPDGERRIGGDLEMTSAKHHARPHNVDAAETPRQPSEPADADAPPAGAPAEPAEPAEPDAPDAPDAGPTVAELEDRWRRAVAELHNLRKRFERQLAERARAERARTAAAFLPVLDNLELALRHADADPAAIVTGVRAVHAQAIDVLSGLGYQRIDTAGVRFDPARHEAAGTAPATDCVPAGTVVDVHRAGYSAADGTLVRPAVVTVAQAPGHQQAPAAADQQTTTEQNNS